MMRFIPFVAFCLACLPAVSWANQANQLNNVKVTVFTTQQYPIIHPQFADQIYHLDAAAQLEAVFSKQIEALGNQPALAEDRAKALLFSADGQVFQAQLTAAYEGVTEGWKQGIKKVPAVLFEQPNVEPLVIYGQANVAYAVEQFKQYHR